MLILKYSLFYFNVKWHELHFLTLLKMGELLGFVGGDLVRKLSKYHFDSIIIQENSFTF
jgi:hypothetical protein